jgi:protein-tyrosine phosphatase
MDVFSVRDNLAVATRPRGGDWLPYDLAELRANGFDVLVSCLTQQEERDLDLQDEAKQATAAGLEFVSVPINDRELPQHDVIAERAALLVAQIRKGQRVAIHCRQGLGRAPLVAGALMVLSGAGADDAWAEIERARGKPVPDTPEQRAWLESFARRQSLARDD